MSEKQRLIGELPAAGYGCWEEPVKSEDDGWLGLNRRELELAAGEPFWTRARAALFYAFWLTFLVMAAAVAALVAAAPKCAGRSCPLPVVDSADENATMRNANATTDDAGTILADVNSIVASMNAIVANLNATIEELDVVVAKVNATVVGADAAMADARTTMADMNSTMVDINATIAGIRAAMTRVNTTTVGSNVNSTQPFTMRSP